MTDPVVAPVAPGAPDPGAIIAPAPPLGPADGTPFDPAAPIVSPPAAPVMTPLTNKQKGIGYLLLALLAAVAIVAPWISGIFQEWGIVPVLEFALFAGLGAWAAAVGVSWLRTEEGDTPEPRKRWIWGIVTAAAIMLFFFGVPLLTTLSAVEPTRTLPSEYTPTPEAADYMTPMPEATLVTPAGTLTPLDPTEGGKELDPQQAADQARQQWAALGSNFDYPRGVLKNGAAVRHQACEQVIFFAPAEQWGSSVAKPSHLYIFNWVAGSDGEHVFAPSDAALTEAEECPQFNAVGMIPVGVYSVQEWQAKGYTLPADVNQYVGFEGVTAGSQAVATPTPAPAAAPITGTLPMTPTATPTANQALPGLGAGQTLTDLAKLIVSQIPTTTAASCVAGDFTHNPSPDGQPEIIEVGSQGHVEHLAFYVLAEGWSRLEISYLIPALQQGVVGPSWIGAGHTWKFPWASCSWMDFPRDAVVYAQNRTSSNHTGLVVQFIQTGGTYTPVLIEKNAHMRSDGGPSDAELCTLFRVHLAAQNAYGESMFSVAPLVAQYCHTP